MASSFTPQAKKNQPRTKVTKSLREDLLIFEALNKHKFLNRRQLNEITQITVASLCRSLYDLEIKKVIKVAFKALDPETGRSVYNYTLLLERRAV